MSRHNDNGSLDVKFDGSGIDYLFGPYVSVSNVITVDHQDRIVVGSTIYYPLIGCDKSPWAGYFSVTRLRGLGDSLDGQPDDKFGSSAFAGTRMLHPADCNSNASLQALVLDSNDAVIGAGSVQDSMTGQSSVTVARWTAGGNLDGSFGSGGFTTVPYPHGTMRAVGIALDSEGRILVAAQANDGIQSPVTVARLKANGTTDTSFGDSGYIALTFDRESEACCITVDSTNRILIAGEVVMADTYAFKVFLARLNELGEFDKSFGVNGVSWIDDGISSDFVSALTIDRSGKIIAAGSSDGGDGLAGISTFYLNSDGSLNKSVGYGGIYRTAFGLHSSSGSAIALDKLNRTTVAGLGLDRDGFVPVLVRYDGIFGDGLD